MREFFSRELITENVLNFRIRYKLNKNKKFYSILNVHFASFFLDNLSLQILSLSKRQNANKAERESRTTSRRRKFIAKQPFSCCKQNVLLWKISRFSRTRIRILSRSFEKVLSDKKNFWFVINVIISASTM